MSDLEANDHPLQEHDAAWRAESPSNRRLMRGLALVYTLLLVIPAIGAFAIVVPFFLFPPAGVLGLLLVATVVYQLRACGRLWTGDDRPVLPSEKNAFGGGALVSTIILSWYFSLPIDGRGHWYLAGGLCLLLTSALLPLTLTHAHKHDHLDDDEPALTPNSRPS